MMPVVDAGVSLSQNEFSFNEYLHGSKQFHVLRMVAVQHQQAVATGSQELTFFQTQATTRGLGGFPNAIVASVDLLSPSVIKNLVDVQALENLRGVCHRFVPPYDVCIQSDWEQSLKLLAKKRLCLDLFAAQASDAIIVKMAAYKPELNIILNIAGGAQSRVQNTTQRLALLAKYDNIHLKICGAECLTSGANNSLVSLINSAIALFGFERIMFASGVYQHSAENAFDQLWTQYVNACSSLSANYRDCLFRTNAIRVYGL